MTIRLTGTGTIPAPMIDAAQAALGPSGGGTLVRILGRNLSAVTVVRFGNANASFDLHADGLHREDASRHRDARHPALEPVGPPAGPGRFRYI